ncbi:hypothetical protein ACIBG0_21945 [Nocardia sp. NPDC050630]|uniref:hypothetical protein n=1 Tax=Nocardia sp. NPDC050630 TaxID=3364321 RepID=UPI0037A6213F
MVTGRTLTVQVSMLVLSARVSVVFGAVTKSLSTSALDALGIDRTALDHCLGVVVADDGRGRIDLRG